MQQHDIVVIGASAGGVEALRAIVRELPADLPASYFITLHVAVNSPGLLAELLNYAGPIPAAYAAQGDPIVPRQIAIAPPDHHLLVGPDHMHVVRGPRENGFRPAIDAMFRTAARSYGTRVLGVILTGMLDDGTAGLLAIKRHGGLALVQDPNDASYPSMPESALRYVEVDAVLPLAKIGAAIGRMVAQPVNQPGEPAMSDMIDRESAISAMQPDALEHAEQFGATMPYSCPDCGGVLVEYYDGDLLRFRCQVGHAFSRESMLSGHGEYLDRSLWAAFAALDERVNLAQRLAQDARRQGDTLGIRRFEQLTRQAERRKSEIREVLLKRDE